MPAKRKRHSDRPSIDASANRPSPHRPEQTFLGRHDVSYPEGGGGGGRGGRGGRQTRSGRGDRRESMQNNFSAPIPSPTSPTVTRPQSASSHATPAPLSMAPASAPPSAPPSPTFPNYDYSIVTEERIASWKTDGRQAVIDHGVQSRNDEDTTEVSALFQELLHSVLDSRIDPVDAGGIVKEVVQSEMEATASHFAFDPRVLFLDTVSIFMDVETINFRGQFREFMMAAEIPHALMRQVLDPQFMTQLGLIRETFVKVGIRQSTNLLYRQANYNLLREESEGFSKLVNELYTSLRTDPDADYPWDAAQATFERVKGLIGTFDLDVGRVFDISLDVFAATIVKQLHPFLKFLRISSWWPRAMSKTEATAVFSGLPRWACPELAGDGLTESDHEAAFEEKKLARDIVFWNRARDISINAFYELGDREVADAELQRLIASDEDAGYSEAEREWIKITKTMPASGNRTAAQILGFKLRFYQTPENEGTKVPGNLLWVAAVLIKIGFISLTDIYPHVYHPDEEMKDYQDELEKELRRQRAKSRPGATANALTAAGALPDDTLPSGATNQSSRRLGDSAASKPETDRNGKDGKTKGGQEDDDVYDQKCLLLEHLLLIGAIPEALFIIGRFPWLVELAGPKVLPGLHRILEYAIDKVYSEAAPVPADVHKTQACPPKQVVDLDQTGVSKGDIRLTDPIPRRFLRWPHPDKMDHLEGQNYRYYFNEWKDNVPVCQNIEDVLTLCNTLLNISGANIGLHATLLAKLTAIGTHSLHLDKSPENFERWRALLQRLLVPALSHTGENSYLVDAVWAMLKLYPTHVRYSIYADWYEGPTSRLPGMRDAFEVTRLSTQGTMKRLSADNIKKMARTMAKAAYSSPGIVFKVALEQIEAYSNLIEAFIECAKYFTDLGYDVLLWSLLSSLSTSRSRTSSASVLNTSQWLQALSKFSGQVFRRYANLNPTPVLLYVNEQLCRGNSTDLVILERLITSMGGVVSDVDFTDAQLEAMTGGPILRKQTLINVQDKRFDSSTQKSALRFMRALLSNDLAGRLLVSIVQHRQVAIYQIPEDEAHIKYLASIVDSTQKILSQFLDLLRSNLEPEQFDATVPDLVSLLSEFGLDVSLAFMVGRGSLTFISNPPKVAAALPSPKEELGEAPAVPTPSADAEGDVSMGSAGEGSSDNSSGDQTAPTQQELSAPQSSQVDAVAPAADGSRNGDQFLELLQPLSAAVQPLLSPEVWKSMSPEFYVIFWSLQLSDIVVPQPSYEAENSRLRSQLEETIRDRSDMSKAGQQKKAERRTNLEGISKQLREEMVQLAERNLKIRIRVAKGKPSWFSADAHPNDVHDTLIEQCLLPRLLLTATDSIYTFRAVKFLHENRTPNLKLMTLFDRLFNANRLRTMIFTCTMGEAVHFGRFLRFVLADLASWHRSKGLYEDKGLGLIAKTGKRTYLGFASSIDDKGVPQSFVEHDPFRDLLYGWHKNLNTALKSCLQGSEWMHIRNALTVLSSIVEVFPAVDFMGSQFTQQLDAIKVREKDRHADLATAAGMVESSLKRRKPKWVMVQAFRPNISGEPQEEAKASTEPPQTAGKNLRPSAPDFKPRGVNSVGSASVRRIDVEDGEVKDGRGSNATAPAQAQMTAQLQERKAAIASDKDTAQKSPAPSTLPAGNIAGLPKRPDVPMPGQGLSRNHRDAPREPRDSRDGRGSRETRDFREARDNREPRDDRDARDTRESRDARVPDSSRSERPAREFAGSERRGADNNNNSNAAARESSRLSDKDRGSRAEKPSRRIESVADRESRPSRESTRDAARDLSRDNLKDLPRDRNGGPRSHDGSRSGPRDSSRDPSGAAPRGSGAPTVTVPTESQEPAINPARARLLAEDHPDKFPPDRAPMPHRERRDSPARSPRDDPRQRAQPARPASPHRGEQFRIETVSSDRERNQSQSRESHGSDKHRDREGDRVAGDRSRHMNDQDHGRLSHHDPNYGRLNPIQSVASEGPSAPPSGPPSGPRGRGGREPSSRLSSLDTSGPPPSWPEGRISSANGDVQRAASPDRQPPTGPASGRNSIRKTTRGQYEAGSNVESPSSSVAPSPTTGVHPDRMRLVSGTPGSGPGPGSGPPHSSSGPISANSIPINPNRLNHINSRSAPSQSQSQSPAPPRQPMGPPLHTPDRASHTGRGNPLPSNIPTHTPASDPRGAHSAPSGPGSASDRGRNRGPRAMMDSINTTLEKAGQENRATYSDSNRSSYSNTRVGGRSVPDSDARVLTGGSPASTPTHERPNPILRDLPNDRGHGSSFGNDMPPRGGPAGGGGDYSNHAPNGSSGSRDGRDHERSSSRKEHRESRSGRPSRRSSRERSGDRGGDRGERESREHREGGRDRRSAAPSNNAAHGGSSHGRDGERESSSRSRSARDSTGGGGGREPIPSLAGGRESLGGSGREPRHRGDGPRDHSSGGSGSSRGGRSGGGGGPGMPTSRPSDDHRDGGGGGGGGGRDDRGSRKRRSEDAAGLSHDRDKRQRR